MADLPGTFDIAAYRGDTKQWTAAFADDNGNPFDMSAWTWLAQIRSTRDEPNTIVATFTVDATSAASGQLTITLPATEAAKLTTTNGKGLYYWDLQGTDSGTVKTWLTGKVKVTGDVSVAP